MAVCQDQERGESNLLSNASRFPTEHCFLEGSQVSSVCPSGEIGVQIEMFVLHWWNDTDRGNRNSGRKTFHIDTLSTIHHTGTGLGSNPATNRLNHDTVP